MYIYFVFLLDSVSFLCDWLGGSFQQQSEYQTAILSRNLHGTYIQLPRKDSAPWSSHNRPSRGTPPEKNNMHVSDCRSRKKDWKRSRIVAQLMCVSY